MNETPAPWKKQWLTFDSEVSGVEGTARILALGTNLFIDGKVATTSVDLFNPGESEIRRAHPAMLQCNHITRGDLRKMRSFKDRIEDVREYFSERVWVTHHAPFDLERLAYEFQIAGQDFGKLVRDALVLDTRSLSAMLLRVRRPEMLGLRQTAAAWDVRVAPGGVLIDAETSGCILVAMAQYLPDSIDDMREVQRMAHRYVRFMTGDVFTTLH